MDEQSSDTPPESNPAIPSEPGVTAKTPAPGPVKAETPPELWQALRSFLACNPFYPVSAALLLYSFYLISADRNFLPTEVGQLSFNLSSLQIYQALVVITAIFLARRAVWYDSTLLVGLENLLLLVPFILISQAALIQSHLVWFLCLAAGVLALGRLSLLRAFISELNFPRRMALMGSLVLLVNALLPAVYRVLHESKVGTKPDWGAAYETNQYVWWVLMPIFCGLIVFVPWARAAVGELCSQRRWLPTGFFSLWLVGTGVHLYCLGYVYDFTLRPELLAPDVWALCWAICLKLEELQPDLKQVWNYGLWVSSAVATLLATPQPQKTVFLVLTTLNTVLFVSIFVRTRARLALHLALISMAALAGGLPENVRHLLVSESNQATWVAAAAVIYFLACTALSRHPHLGILGGLVAGISIGVWVPQPAAIHWAIQIGLVFLLLHSLRWVDFYEHGAALVRCFAALVWVAHSIVWTHFYNAGWGPCLVALPVLSACSVLRWRRGNWRPVTVPVASLLVLLSAPGHAATVQLQSTPTGLVAVLGSFLLFGLGTLGAISKHRWASGKAQSAECPKA